MRENAVVVRAGSNSLHPSWVCDGDRNFDLLVAAYEDIPAESAQCADRLFTIRGNKVAGFAKLFEDHAELLSNYARIALIDDDIECDATALSRLFDLGREFDLRLWQPSLSYDSYFSYAITVRNPAFLLRYVNFVEMMCPFFRSDFLREAAPLFSLGYETGIDRLWSRCCPSPQEHCAIVDAVSVRHARPVGENRAAQGFVGASATYDDVLDKMHRLVDLEHVNPVVYSGVTTGRRRIAGRIAACLLSLAPLLSFPRMNGPKALKKFAILAKANWRFRTPASDSVRNLADRLKQSADLGVNV